MHNGYSDNDDTRNVLWFKIFTQLNNSEPQWNILPIGMPCRPISHCLCLVWQPAPFPNKPLRLADDEIVEEEDDFDESDSETSVASEADDDETSRNLSYEGLKQDHLVPVDLEMGLRTAEKDPVVYSLPARKLLIGDITDDIPENVKVVRIFTSSTFTGILIKNNIWLSNSWSKHLQVEMYRY